MSWIVFYRMAFAVACGGALIGVACSTVDEPWQAEDSPLPDVVADLEGSDLDGGLDEVETLEEATVADMDDAVPDAADDWDVDLDPYDLEPTDRGEDELTTLTDRDEDELDAAAEPHPCGSIACPAGFVCESDTCHDDRVALVVYDLTALRVDGALDVHVLFDAGVGGEPVELAVVGVRLQIPAVEVAYSGPGVYVSELRDDEPWWASEPLLLSRSRDVEQVLEEGASATVMAQSYQDMGWGVWQNAISANQQANRDRRQAHLDAGLPLLGYMEGTGNLFVFLASIDDPPQTIGETDVTRTHFTHWSWGAWGDTFPADQQVIWMGPHTFYDAESYAEPYTLDHPLFGDPIAPVDTDGDPLVSPPQAASDPRLEGLYRECAATDINGEPALDLHLQGGRDVTGLPGVVEIDGSAYSILGFSRDPACPTWLRFHAASLRFAEAEGTVGCWMDNVSMWDAWGSRPVERAFGAYSNAGFEGFLLERASPEFLQRSGLERHLGAMNMRCIVKWKARTAFGDDVASAGRCADPIAFRHAGLMDERWDSDLPWRAWAAYQVQLHIDYYAALEPLLAATAPDFLWGVNDLPVHGAVVGEAVPPSMNLSELTVGPHVLTGGVRLPPVGSPAPLYDLAGAFDRAQFQTVWMYIEDAVHQDRPGLHTVLAVEALAHDTFLMPAANDARAPGTTQSAAELHGWLLPHARALEGRRPWCRTGLVYSPASFLLAYRPGGAPSVEIPWGEGVRHVHDFSHLHEFAGWHLALQRTHHQPCPLILGRLDAEALLPFDVVILPDVWSLPSEILDEVLTPFVDGGGTLIITGRTGRFEGRERMFEPYDRAAAPVGSASLTGIDNLDRVEQLTTVEVGAGRVVIVPGTPGAEAWQGRGDTDILDAIGRIDAMGLLPSSVLEPPGSETVGVRLHVDMLRGRLYVDLFNRGWNPQTDALEPPGVQRVTVLLPAWLRGVPLEVVTVGGRGRATATEQGDGIELEVDGLHDLVTVVVESSE